MSKSLTKTQRKILWLMREHGHATIIGGTRHFGWNSQHSTFGLMIQAYFEPERALRTRKLIQTVPSNTGLPRWELTEEGERRAAALKWFPR